LYHIIENYDNLADVTIFIPGSCMMNDEKSQKTVATCRYAESTMNSVFIGYQMQDVKEDLYSFSLNEYVTSAPENRSANPESSIKRCSIRPFGKWYTAVFGDLKTTLVDYKSIFAVSRDHIRQHPKEYYHTLIKFVNDDVSPECGHYMERSWVAVFSPLPSSCLYASHL
jgi:hypothetical protein